MQLIREGNPTKKPGRQDKACMHFSVSYVSDRSSATRKLSGDGLRVLEADFSRPCRSMFNFRVADIQEFLRSIHTSRLINEKSCRFIKDRPPRDGLSRIERFATFTTLPYSFESRSRLFGSHLARSQAGTTSARGCYRSRRSLLPYALRRNAPTRAG